MYRFVGSSAGTHRMSGDILELFWESVYELFEGVCETEAELLFTCSSQTEMKLCRNCSVL